MACVGEIMTIEFIETDDWVELVVDGKRVLGNHTLRTSDVLRAIGVEFKEIYIEDNDEFLDYLNLIDAV